MLLEHTMSYPLFDSGYTLWAADLEARLMERHGVTSRVLGVGPGLLLECYYRGGSVDTAIGLIAQRYGLA